MGEIIPDTLEQAWRILKGSIDELYERNDQNRVEIEKLKKVIEKLAPETKAKLSVPLSGDPFHLPPSSGTKARKDQFHL